MTGEQPTVAHGVAGDTEERPAVSPADATPQPDAFAERPEAFVAGAFAGGLMLAMVLRRLRR